MENGIRKIDIKKDKNGRYKQVLVTFGPHYGVNIFEKNGRVVFELVATHHGFRADATDLPSELEKLINEVMYNHKDMVIDDLTLDEV